MKKSELLKTEHDVQFNWLKNQMAKIGGDGRASFLNADVAERSFEKLSLALVLDYPDLEHFISVHLSPGGMKKLVTSLRVRSNRNNSIQLQVEISRKNKIILDGIMEKTGKTQKQIIDILLSNAKDLVTVQPLSEHYDEPVQAEDQQELSL